MYNDKVEQTTDTITDTSVVITDNVGHDNVTDQTHATATNDSKTATLTQPLRDASTRKHDDDTQLITSTNNVVTSKFYTVKKILRKKFCNNTWQYRLKWLTFPNSQNSWVEFKDLSSDLQTLVTSIHTKIPTDKRSQKKR